MFRCKQAVDFFFTSSFGLAGQSETAFKAVHTDYTHSYLVLKEMEGAAAGGGGAGEKGVCHK